MLPASIKSRMRPKRWKRMHEVHQAQHPPARCAPPGRPAVLCHAMPRRCGRGGRRNRRQRRQPQCPRGAEVRLWRSCADGDFLATGTLFGATSPLGTHPARRHHGPDGWPTFINLRPAVTRFKASLDVDAAGVEQRSLWNRTVLGTGAGAAQPLKRQCPAEAGRVLLKLRMRGYDALRLRCAAIATRPEARRSAVVGSGITTRWAHSSKPPCEASVLPNAE